MNSTSGNDLPPELSSRTLYRQIVPLFRQAGKFVVERFREESVTQHRKPDGSLVSSVDHAVHEFLSSRLKKRFGVAVLSEEGDPPDIKPEDPFWIIDPLDGTSTFLKGEHRFFILGAYARNGKIQHSIVIHPLSEDVHMASRGCGAWYIQKGGRPVAWRANGSGDRAGNSGEGEVVDGWGGDGHQKLRERLQQHTGLEMITPTTQEVSLLAVAGGKRRFYVGAAPIWDIAAPSLILTERGGQITDLKGNELRLEENLEGDFIPCVATRGVQHDRAVELVETLSKRLSPPC